MPATLTAVTSQTAAATSSDIHVEAGETIQVWSSPMLPVGESVAFYRTDGASVEEKIIDDGKALAVSRETPNVLFTGPAILRLKKSATATATAVYYDR